MDISVVIATIGRDRDLIKALRSIEVNSIKPFEVLIIDQGDIQPRIFENINLNLILIKINKKSSAQARNIGIELAKGDVVTFLDDDIILDGNYFKEVLDSFKKYNKIKIVQGKITNLRGKKILNIFWEIFLGSGSIRRNNFIRLYNFENISYNINSNYEEYCMWVGGCDINVKKDVFDYEKFDSQLIRYSSGEDLDFSYRVFKRFGEKSILFQPKAELVHNVSPNGRLARYDLMLMRRIHKIYFVYKNYRKEKNIIRIIKCMWYIFGCLIFNILKIFKGNYKSIFYFFTVEYQAMVHRQDIKNLNIEWMNIKLFNEKSVPEAKIVEKICIKRLQKDSI